MLKSLCETRWTEKYKSISHFSSNIINIVEALEEFSLNGNGETRKKANYTVKHTKNTRSDYLFYGHFDMQITYAESVCAYHITIFRKKQYSDFLNFY